MTSSRVSFTRRLGAPSRLRQRTTLTMAALAITGLVAVGCGSGEEDATTSDRYSGMTQGLCEVVDEAGAKGLGAAEQVFYDTVHGPLHDLAAEVAAADRDVAAGLLEAKQAAEAGLAARTGATTRSLAQLVDAAGRALDTIGHPPPSCTEPTP